MSETRWKQRFQNFKKSYDVFKRMKDRYEDSLVEEEVIKMALTQSYEILTELSWKTVKDYLKEEGISENSPKAVIRKAFQIDLLDNHDTEVMLKSLELRNLTTHTYDEDTLEELVLFIVESFSFSVERLHQALEGHL